MVPEVEQQQPKIEFGSLKARELFTTFYEIEPADLDRIYCLYELKPASTRRREVADNMELIEDVPFEKLRAEYFGLHNSAYVKRLEQMTHNVPEGFVDKETKLLVVIAARNEIHTSRAIQALRNSYADREAFQKEVRILVYHNYKTEAEKQYSIQDLEVCQSFGNTCVVSEQVLDFNTLAAAKKVVSDLAMFISQDDIPLLLTDADIESLTPEVMQEATRALEMKQSLAVTLIYLQNTQGLKEKFPLLYLYFYLDFLARLRYLKPDQIVNLNGQFTILSSKLLMGIGGIKPTRFSVKDGNRLIKVSPIAYEDSMLAIEIDNLYSGKEERTPLHNFSTEGHYITVGVDREILALLNGQDANARWNFASGDLHRSITGSKRLQLQDVDPEDLPQFSKMTKENLRNILTMLINHLEKSFSRTKKINTFLILLHELGIYFKAEIEDQKGNITIKDVSAESEPLQIQKCQKIKNLSSLEYPEDILECCDLNGNKVTFQNVTKVKS